MGDYLLHFPPAKRKKKKKKKKQLKNPPRSGLINQIVQNFLLAKTSDLILTTVWCCTDSFSRKTKHFFQVSKFYLQKIK